MERNKIDLIIERLKELDKREIYFLAKELSKISDYRIFYIDKNKLEFVLELRESNYIDVVYECLENDLTVDDFLEKIIKEEYKSLIDPDTSLLNFYEFGVTAGFKSEYNRILNEYQDERRKNE